MYVDPARGIVAGLFPAQVAAVRIRFRGGGSELVPATEGLGYTGRYRSAVHFAFAPLRRDKVVTGATLLDASGREIGRASADGPGIDRQVARRPSLVLATGGERLFAGALATPQSSFRHLCIGLERGDCREDLLLVEMNSVTALVPCDRRRTVVFGVTRRAVSRVEIGAPLGVSPREARERRYRSGECGHRPRRDQQPEPAQQEEVAERRAEQLAGPAGGARRAGRA